MGGCPGTMSASRSRKFPGSGPGPGLKATGQSGPGLKSRGTTTFRDKNPGQSREGTAFQGFYVTPSRPLTSLQDTFSKHLYQLYCRIQKKN